MVGYRGLGRRTWMLAGAAVAVIGAPAWANEIRRFDIPSQDLAGALETFGRQSEQDIVFDAGLLRGKRAPAVIGPYRPDDALQRLLSGSGLGIRRVNASSVIVEGAGPQVVAAAGPAEPAVVEELVVTGTRIRGAPPASPVTIVTADDMRNAGHQDLGEVARALPQNFAGGQNPGAGQRTAASSTSFAGNGASTLNLRGIGNDATLTLLNGHRLTTNADAGVDIGAVPLLAVDRLEVLADGASALYGSDAVGGVANIIVRPDRDRVTISALYGASTDGGYDHTRYNAAVERTWSGGGVLAAASLVNNSDIQARQRSYTAGMGGDNSLFPDQNRLNLFVAARQELSRSLTVSVDALYNNLSSFMVSAYGAGSFRATGQTSRPTVRSFVIAPSIELTLGSWLMNAYATYGDDRTRTNAVNYSGGLVTSTSRSCFCNRSSTFEASAEGPVFRLPGGDARVAIGGGYRSSHHDYSVFRSGIASALPFSQTDGVKYAFGEFTAPLVSGNQAIPFIDSLRATAALRYEDYPRLGSVTTPKLGLVYGVTPSFRLKGSWGKSFKAPSFVQRYSQSQILLTAVSGYGSLFPASSTFLRKAGGNANLKPERAATYNVSAEFTPASIAGLRIELSYFHVDFKDRVITPFSLSAGVLNNPLFTDLVQRNPTAAQQAEAIAQSTTGLINSTTAPYDPAKVVAIADSRYTNAAAQVAQGLDLAITYRRDLVGGRLYLTGAASYLDITQQRLAREATLGVTGNFYQPRHFRARSGVAWERGGLSLAAYLNYVGAARYRPVTPIQDVKADTTLDLTTRWAIPGLSNTTVGLSLVNALNSQPTVVSGLAYETSYDATAYSATGRVAAVSLTKNW